MADRVREPTHQGAEFCNLLLSFRALFTVPGANEPVFREVCYADRLRVLYRVMLMLGGERGNGPGLPDLLQCLIQRPTIGEALRAAVADALVTHMDVDRTAGECEQLLMRHAQAVLGPGIALLRQRLAAEHLGAGEVGSSLLQLAIKSLGEPDPVWAGLQLPLARANQRKALRRWLMASDRFSAGWTYRASLSGIRAAPVAQTRPLEMLYGYHHEKSVLKEHFGAFVAGRMVPPLALWGLPGLGKTHFTIAYAQESACTLLTADERALEEGLEALLLELGRYRHRQFVLFFDDIETEGADWGMFRHQVSGHLPYPPNVAIVLASNYPFPPSVRSRCTSLAFRPVDPAVCKEIVLDYLHKQMCLSGEHQRLACVMVADYVNEYVQHNLPELSPRTLIRYLEKVEVDADLRRRLVDESLVEPVRMPTVEMFMESNKRLVDEMNVGRQRYTWRPQDFHE